MLKIEVNCFLVKCVPVPLLGLREADVGATKKKLKDNLSVKLLDYLAQE